MIKRAVLLLLGLTVFFPLASARADSMSFRLVTLGGHCAGRCPQVIAAQGEIVEDTPDAFLSFVRENAAGGDLHSIILLDSPGGKVGASMELGHVLRRLRAAVIVARPAGDTEATGDLLAGSCYSACVYALMGGRKRIIPPLSSVGVHRMFNYVLSPDPAGGEPLRRRNYDDGNMRSRLLRYSSNMGVKRDLINYAESTSADRLRVLSRAEIKRWRLGSDKF